MRTGAREERTHNPLPPMESHACMERGQTADTQQRTTNHIALPSRKVSSLIRSDVFNIDAPAIGGIRLNIFLYRLLAKNEPSNTEDIHRTDFQIVFFEYQYLGTIIRKRRYTIKKGLARNFQINLSHDNSFSFTGQNEKEMIISLKQPYRSQIKRE